MRYSPLRYPGGKNKLAAFIAKICIDNNINGHYVEPYSGGSSVALFLLLEGYVDRITINDKDRSIYAFWHSVLNNTKALIEKIENAELTIEEWKRQREVQSEKNRADLLELGFSTFYLNRTCRSGIITGGVIGGYAQDGDYRMNCRFNKEDLVNRIKLIASKKKKIRLYKKDAIKLIDKIENEADGENTLIYFDPPYYYKADSLYMNFYQHGDHEKVGERIQAIEGIKWVVSYDNVPEIKEIFRNFPCKDFQFIHTAFQSREGKEVMFFGNNIQLPKEKKWDPIGFRKYANSNEIYYEAPSNLRKKRRLVMNS
ncbi:MAG TPA: DNA adenine methylase [Salinimicrobium sp.]|nr:DNA adenine methylase [Salinimicrobium sp.]